MGVSKTASFFLSLSACQARSAKREEGGYIFLVVFAVCGTILPFLPRKKPQRDPFSLDIRGKKIPTVSGGLFLEVDGENVYYLGENVRKKKTNHEQSILLPVNSSFSSKSPKDVY